MGTTRAGAEVAVDPFLEAVDRAVRAAPRLRPEVRDRIVNLLGQGRAARMNLPSEARWLTEQVEPTTGSSSRPAA
jgi:hypothetical protein